jgi:hypothetical protein
MGYREEALALMRYWFEQGENDFHANRDFWENPNLDKAPSMICAAFWEFGWQTACLLEGLYVPARQRPKRQKAQGEPRDHQGRCPVRDQ